MRHQARAIVSSTLVCLLGCSAPVKSGCRDVDCVGASGASGGAPSAGRGGSSGTGGSSAVVGGSGGAASTAGGSASSLGGSASAGAAQGGSLGVGGGAGSAGAGGSTGGGALTACAARPGLLFCDDFESATVGAVPNAPWSSALNGDGTVTVDSSVPAHSGAKSVHVHGSGFQTLLVYHDAAVLPRANGRFFFRAFVRSGAAMTAGHNTLMIADTFAAPGAGNTTRVGEMNAMLMMTVGGDAHGYLSNQNYYNDMKPGVAFAVQAYTCVEMLFDAPNTEIDVWVDGKEVPDMHVTNLAHENYDALRFGFEQYSGPVSDYWYDDIAIGSQQLGCN